MAAAEAASRRRTAIARHYMGYRYMTRKAGRRTPHGRRHYVVVEMRLFGLQTECSSAATDIRGHGWRRCGQIRRYVAARRTVIVRRGQFASSQPRAFSLSCRRLSSYRLASLTQRFTHTRISPMVSRSRRRHARCSMVLDAAIAVPACCRLCCCQYCRRQPLPPTPPPKRVAIAAITPHRRSAGITFRRQQRATCARCHEAARPVSRS